MRFSIITITLNAEHFIEQSLISVSSQDFKSYEHIIWDGGSTDRTLEIIKLFPHAKLYSGKDNGISDAMNRGAHLAKGEYILFLHSDDLLANNSVLNEVDGFLTQKGNPLWAYGTNNIINHSGELIRTANLIPFNRKQLRKYNIITHPATFVSRQLFFKAGGFRTELKYCMDYELWLRLSRTETAIDMPIVVASFREHQGSLSTREKIKVANEAYHVRNEYVQNLWERFQSFRTWKRRCRKLYKT